MKFDLTAFLILVFCVLNFEIYAQKKVLVSVPVTVSDREGRYIPNLKKSDFTIFQNGVKQEISSFATDNEPLSVALMIDTSRSTSKIVEKIKDAAKDFVGLLNAEDQCLIATFDSQVSILNQFTSDHSTLKETIDNLKIDSRSGTVMRRAVSQIVGKSFARVKGRKAIILLTDGKDFGSYQSTAELVEQLQESDVMIYTVFYKTGVNLERLEKENKKYEKLLKKMRKKSVVVQVPGNDAEAPSIEEIKFREVKDDLEAVNTLKAISETTAGRFYLREAADLGKTFNEITGELRKKYRLEFYAAEAKANSPLSEITVDVSVPNAVVYARSNFRQMTAAK